jgi:2-oxoacid:acceptor oxidoreductase gamma subunit (pyruvate/2-ketoisovalerate family)
MFEIRFHGRGGQGVVTCAELLATAIIMEGKFAQAKPSFGSERRGAPVQAFLRTDDKRIVTRSDIYNPDAVVILDPLLGAEPDTLKGLKEGGYIILNTTKSLEEVMKKLKFKGTYCVVNATEIAVEKIKIPVANTSILGAFLKVKPIVSKETIKEVYEERFGKMGKQNYEAFELSYEKAMIGSFNG